MRQKIKMLIVEDNEDERLFMKEGFTQTGLYEIVGEAENGNQMLDLLMQPGFSLPQLVLSDLNMPGKNGYEVIKDVKENISYAHIPVVILTTAPLIPYAERCRKLGACAYFTKPDTFLEYKLFAETIYSDVINNCLNTNN
jgi:CheY-like chemotaxis protein